MGLLLLPLRAGVHAAPLSIGPICVFMGLAKDLSSQCPGSLSRRRRNKHKTCVLSLVGCTVELQFNNGPQLNELLFSDIRGKQRVYIPETGVLLFAETVGAMLGDIEGVHTLQCC